MFDDDALVCAGFIEMFSLSHVLQTSETLLNYRNEEFLCDTILMARDCQLKAHSVILAAVSPVFKAAFCTGSFPSGTFQVDLLLLPPLNIAQTSSGLICNFKADIHGIGNWSTIN